MKKVIITESDRSEILKMYGLLNEQKYMKDYSGTLLDFCGYRAIEKFEETSGTTNGTSMGDDYFEGQVDDFESKISDNIQNTIGLGVFSKLPPKMRMQIWSFMFNGTDASQGTVKWLAGLSQAMNMGKFTDDKDAQEYRIKVNKKGSNEFNDAVQQIINFKGNWDDVYNNYLVVLDKQYKSTAENNNKKTSYENSWKFRPKSLSKYYDECGSNNTPKTKINSNNTKPNSSVESVSFVAPIYLKKDAFNELSKKIQKFTEENIFDYESYSIDSVELKYNPNRNEIIFKMVIGPGNLKIKKVVLAINDESKRAQESKGYKLIESGKIQLPGEFASSKPGGYDWYLFAELIK
jgi:hypothetical protein